MTFQETQTYYASLTMNFLGRSVSELESDAEGGGRVATLLFRPLALTERDYSHI